MAECVAGVGRACSCGKLAIGRARHGASTRIAYPKQSSGRLHGKVCFPKGGDAMVSITPGLCPIVLQRTARLLALAMVLVAGYVFGWPSHEAQAQQAQQGSQINPDSLVIRPRRLKLRDVWGPPKMPPTPKDFGPHFDFPAGGSMNLECGPPDGKQYFCGGPSQAPYPN